MLIGVQVVAEEAQTTAASVATAGEMVVAEVAMVASDAGAAA